MEDNKIKWLDNGGNYLLKDKDFYISYRPFTSFGFGGGFDGDNNGSSETALYNNKEDTFYILNGDFRKEYEKVFNKGYEACKEIFDKFKDKHVSSWSE